MLNIKKQKHLNYGYLNKQKKFNTLSKQPTNYDLSLG